MQDTEPGARGHAGAVDPITLEVVRHGLVSICNQIDANIKRTAFSPYIYEYNDFAVGIVGPDGQLVAQCTGGMPPFVADSVGMAVRDGLEIYGRDRLHQGDVIVCNHSAVQGQHLNNTVMYTPIYGGASASHTASALVAGASASHTASALVAGASDAHTASALVAGASDAHTASAQLIGFFAINVHWIEIGGSYHSSTDIFMEGLQLRSIKLWKKGEPVEEVYRIIETNSRMPLELMGDIAAQLAGCLLGRDLTAALADRYGTATFARAVAAILDQSEAAARAFIRAIPDGEYRTETYLDNDRYSEDPVPIIVKVIVNGDELTVDYSDIAPQSKGPMNSGYFGGGQTIARVAFKYLLGSAEMANEGTFRPIKLILPPGKLISADPTAPMAMYPMPFPTIIDAIIKALETALPARVPGAHFGTHTGVRFYGRRPDGSFFDTHDSGHGGWGACATHDGAGPFRTMAHGDTRIIPLELQETLMPFRLEEFALREDSGGPGKFRGGLGFRKRYRMTGPAKFGTNLDRTKFPPWGVQGGGPARPGRVTVRKAATGKEEPRGKESAYELSAGDLVTVETGGGGGWGPVTQRPLELIQRDVDAGLVSHAAAERDYGVRVGADGKVTR